jgi:hypothetical protein
VKKFLKIAGIAFLVFFIAFRPDSASRIALRVGGVIGDLADGFGRFFAGTFS